MIHTRHLFLLIPAALSAILSGIAQAHPPIPFSPDQFTPPTLDRKTPLPEYEPWKQAPGMVLPPLPKPDPEKLSAVQTVYVRAFRFEGNQAVSDEELQAIAKPYTGRSVDSTELYALRNAVTRRYIDQGYINSGAILPDQKVVDGVIVFKIIEGRLNEINITGTRRLKPGYVLNRLRPDPDKPFNILTLQEKMQILHQDPLIERLNGTLSPGLTPGDAVLNVRVSESGSLKMSVQYANDNTPVSGSHGPEVSLRHINLSGWGDALSGRWKHTSGADEYAFRYTIPISSPDLGLSLFYDRSNIRIIEDPFDLIDITSDAETMGLGLTRPIIKKPRQELSVSLTGEKRSSKTFLFGEPYSFSNNIRDGETDIFVGRLSADLTLYRPNQVFALRSVLSLGWDILDSDSFISEPDGEFLAWLTQFQWSKRYDIVQGDLLILKSGFQLSNESLPPLERFSLGGFNTVRGYRENQLVRDSSVMASVEYRFPVARLPIPKISRGQKDGVVQLAPFFDWGKAWNKGDGPGPQTLMGLGLGIRWDPSDKLHAQVYFAEKLKDIDNTGDDLQDSGVYFSVQWDLL